MSTAEQLRIAFFTDQVYWPDGRGGWSTDEAYVLFPLSLRPHAAELTLLGRTAPEVLRQPYGVPADVTVLSLPHYSSALSLLTRWRPVARGVRDVLRRGAAQWDVVVVAGPGPVANLVARTCASMGLRVVLVVRQELVHHMLRRKRGAARVVAVLAGVALERDFRWLARGRVVLAVGTALADTYARVGAQPVVHYVSLLSRRAVEELAARPRRHDGCTLLYVGRLDRAKGVDVLLRALALVKKERSYVRLEVVGSGEDEHALRRLTAELGLQGAVTFHGYVPFGPRLMEHYRRSVCLVLPSLSEGFPQVVLEALAAGLPVVATPVGGLPGLLEDGESAIFTPPGDPAALACAVTRLLDSPASAERLAARGRELVRHLSLEDVAEDVYRALRQLPGGRAVSPDAHTTSPG